MARLVSKRRSSDTLKPDNPFLSVYIDSETGKHVTIGVWVAEEMCKTMRENHDFLEAVRGSILSTLDGFKQ